ncbi:family 78 glycoside hydrolase catalytic domain [Planctomycetota bacterium]
MPNEFSKSIIFVFLPLCFLSQVGLAQSLEIDRLLCEYQDTPQSVDSLEPVFGWILKSSQRGTKQMAYQVLVADSERMLAENKGNYWDSGKVTSAESTHVVYRGRKLVSSSDYYWKVRVWDQDGKPSVWSRPAHFATSLLDASEWSAEWIGRGPVQELTFPAEGWDKQETLNDQRSTLLRKQFSLNKQVKNTKIHICGLGLFELYVNGTKIGANRELVPLKTDYSKQVLYCSYDITNHVTHNGSNVIGVMLGNGWFNAPKKYWGWKMKWYGSPRAIAQIHIIYQDGSTETIISDQSWKTTSGPIIENSIYDGETYDARKELPGWCTSQFDDSQWQHAHLVEAPGGKLISQKAPPIAVTETLQPKSVQEVKPGVFVFDMGQNFSGWTKISAQGPAGTKIQLQHGENINDDGSLNKKTSRSAKNTDVFILKGLGREVYEPHFTSHGFRYVEVTGYPGQPTLEDIQGRVVHSDCKRTGYFECDNDLVNHLYRCAIWTQRSVMQGLPVDCPQRDERLGWGADAHVMAESGILNFDSYRFYAKWLRDVQFQQDVETGDLPHVSPRPGVTGYPAWSSAYPIINWYCYQYYGDKSLLEKHYENMKRYVDYLQSKSSGHIQPRDATGDWKSVVPGFLRGGPQLISTAFYYYDTRIVADAAKALGKTSDAEKYREMADDIAFAFNNVFQHNLRNNYKYGENTQTENATPLFLDIAPEKTQRHVLQNLVSDIAENNGHLTTGFIGSKWMMEALADYGRADIAYQLLTQTSYPSWGYMTRNRTTMSESWNATSGTNNHAGLGAPIGSWVFNWLAGIQIDPEQPGFKNIIIRPYFPEDMNYVKASTMTIKGLVKSSWEKSNGQIKLSISIPVNTTALVYIPTSDPSDVTENSVEARKSANIDYLRKENNKVIYKVESGQYEFVFRTTK